MKRAIGRSVKTPTPTKKFFTFLTGFLLSGPNIIIAYIDIKVNILLYNPKKGRNYKGQQLSWKEIVVQTSIQKKLASHPRLGPQRREVKESPRFYAIVLNNERAAEWKLAFDAVWDEVCRTGEGGEHSTRILNKTPAFYAGISVEVVEIPKEVAQALYDKQTQKGWKFVVLQKTPGRKNYTKWKPSKEDRDAIEVAKRRAATKLTTFLQSGVLRTAG